jgi:hypothetical protein
MDPQNTDKFCTQCYLVGCILCSKYKLEDCSPLRCDALLSRTHLKQTLCAPFNTTSISHLFLHYLFRLFDHYQVCNIKTINTGQSVKCL